MRQNVSARVVSHHTGQSIPLHSPVPDFVSVAFTSFSVVAVYPALKPRYSSEACASAFGHKHIRCWTRLA